MTTYGENVIPKDLRIRTEEETDATEATLLAAVRAGNLDAFDVLMANHATKIASIVRYFLHDAGDREDAVQETFIRAYERLGQFRSEANFRTWLIRIAINVCKNRRGGNWFRRVQLVDAEALAALEIGDAKSLAESTLLRGEWEQALRQALTELPDHFRLPILLHFFEGMTGAQIAAVLDWRESTVWSRLYAGCRKLREKLADYAATE